MKASLKFRDAEGHPPLLRAKLPVDALGLPFVSSAAASAGDPADLSLRLRTALSSGPALHLSYHPLRPHPFSIALKSGLGPLGSPDCSPLILSARLALSSAPALSFALHFKPSLGHFSFTKSAAVSARLDDFFPSGAAVAVNTSLPVGRCAAVRLRWGVNVPPREAALGQRRLPYLTVEKISIEAMERSGDEAKQKESILDGRGEESGAELEFRNSDAMNINNIGSRDIGTIKLWTEGCQLA